jgi:hypothetical protein
MARAGRAILGAGALAGGLDLGWALAEAALRGAPPGRVPRAIASGLLGRAAFEGGAEVVVLGVALQFVIATGAAAVYRAASRFVPLLLERPALAGAAFGVAVYGVMHLVVLPLSAIPWRVSFAPGRLASGLAAHVLCVGLPIAFTVRRLARPRPRPGS